MYTTFITSQGDLVTRRVSFVGHAQYRSIVVRGIEIIYAPKVHHYQTRTATEYRLWVGDKELLSSWESPTLSDFRRVAILSKARCQKALMEFSDAR